MNSYCIQFLSDIGGVLDTQYVTAYGEPHAIRMAKHRTTAENFTTIEATRL